jgi:hypothetical protein
MYISCRLGLPLWVRLPNQVEILFVQGSLLLLALSTTALPPAPFPRLGLLILLIIDNETFADLEERLVSGITTAPRALGGTYSACGLGIIIVLFLLAGVVHVRTSLCLPWATLASLFVEGLVIFLVGGKLGLARDEVAHTHAGQRGCCSMGRVAGCWVRMAGASRVTLYLPPR